VKEETKKDRGLALKAVESDNYYLDEEMAMITRKLKKFFKKAGGNLKKGSTSKPMSGDRDQFSGCFKYGNRDPIVKNCLVKNCPVITGVRIVLKSWQEAATK